MLCEVLLIFDRAFCFPEIKFFIFTHFIQQLQILKAKTLINTPKLRSVYFHCGSSSGISFFRNSPQEVFIFKGNQCIHTYTNTCFNKNREGESEVVLFTFKRIRMLGLILKNYLPPLPCPHPSLIKWPSPTFSQTSSSPKHGWFLLSLLRYFLNNLENPPSTAPSPCTF